MTLAWLLSIVVMVVGFGFVIFWHELGHFLGARRAGIRVEQFAVGMGHALISYRKGLGVRFGSSMAEFERLTQKEFDAREIREKERRDAEGKLYQIRVGEPSLPERYDIAKDIGLGETEYRISMLPLGGYVKPTGQDDLRPRSVAASDDPKCYAAASVGHRMILISAGVVMNVILAAILFFILFRFVGFNVTRATVGSVQSNSPAAQAGLQSGDQLLEVDGHELADFTKVLMNVALLPGDHPVTLKYKRDGEVRSIPVQAKPTVVNRGMLALGIDSPFTLAAASPNEFDLKLLEDAPADSKLVMPGESIVAVNGQRVAADEYSVFDRALQASFGAPVEITIKDANGVERTASFKPPFADTFNGQPFALASLKPMTKIARIQEESSAKGKLEIGDIILAMSSTVDSEQVDMPDVTTFIRMTKAAGAAGGSLSFTVERDGKTLDVADVKPTTKLPDKSVGLGVGPTPDLEHVRIADTKNSAAGMAGLKPGSTITAVNRDPVNSWGDLHRAFTKLDRGIPATLTLADGSMVDLTPSDEDRLAIASTRYANPIGTLVPWTFKRETNSTFTALGWGVGETRDLILQGYLTIRRVFAGSVPASNMSGPIGIFRAGTGFAQRGSDWFIWFLAVVSANLAVVNFLPVPILDGWHFLSLVKEKITGRPVSERVNAVAQYVGLAMILSLLLFVSYNDIMRW